MSPRPGRGSALIAGGGTAGHLVPGLAIARSLVDQGWPAELIHFVGSTRGVETEMVPAAGFGLTTLPGRGLNERKISLANVRNLFDIVRGVVAGVVLVLRSSPAVVVSLGGYAALPASIGAIVRRVPLVISEQNAVASSTNRLLSRFAKVAAVPFAGVGLRHEVVTGNPVRQEVLDGARREQQRHWPADRMKVVVFGGSLGSLRINRAVWASIEELADAGEVFVYHVVGHRDWPDRPSIAVDANAYLAVEYDHELPVALASADLVISR
ncbi:MAG: glycosyltransferase, partial [Actinomycetota bacterium]|nr:glycosyltransferase [Actinomycetota bacterium]